MPQTSWDYFNHEKALWPTQSFAQIWIGPNGVLELMFPHLLNYDPCIVFFLLAAGKSNSRVSLHFTNFLLVWLQEPLLGWGATVLDKIQASSLHGIVRIPLLLSIHFSSSIHISAFSMFYLNCTETVKQINRRRLSSQSQNHWKAILRSS